MISFILIFMLLINTIKISYKRYKILDPIDRIEIVFGMFMSILVSFSIILGSLNIEYNYFFNQASKKYVQTKAIEVKLEDFKEIIDGKHYGKYSSSLTYSDLEFLNSLTDRFESIKLKPDGYIYYATITDVVDF